MSKLNFRARLQGFGGFLTAMVIPNMGAFIAWGFLTALFIPTGWFPNEGFATLVGPIIRYLLPILLGYTGGTLIHGQRGGVAGVIGTFGLIVGADIPMFLGAMIMGPLSAWIIKKFDGLVHRKIPPGFEMVVNNFSLGIIGLLICLTSYAAIGPAIQVLNDGLTAAVDALVSTGFLPILALLNEPAKVLFLNNVIDQGIYYPLGMTAALESGKSIFFTVASNPGSGLGLLLAYWKFGGTATLRDSAPGAIIIHFFGGIHEIYFPYVLMKPITLLGMIAGSMAGIVTFQLFGAGLVAGPSPGSIFSYLLLTPKGSHVGIIAGVLVAATVSFLVNSFLLKMDSRKKGDGEEDDFDTYKQRSADMKASGKDALSGALGTKTGSAATTTTIQKVIFACDAGMGSSAMGASVFRNKLKEGGRGDIEVTNTSIENIPDDADLVVVHENLAERTRNAKPNIELLTIDSYMGDPKVQSLLDRLTDKGEEN